MYRDKITLFNRLSTADGDLWYASILDADVNIDKAAMISKYGETSKDVAKIHLRITQDANGKHIGAYNYVLPKAWSGQSNTITFKGGQNFDFIVVGEISVSSPVSDNDYTQGYYEYMNAQYDNVFAIDSVAEYSVIPHLEIMAR